MVRALSLLLVVSVGCAKRTPESLVLQDKVADDAGPMSERGCPWDAVTEPRLEGRTLWISGGPWALESPAAVEAFSTLLAVCGEADAIAPLRAWFDAEEEADEQRNKSATKDSLATVGAALVAGAAVAAAGQTAASPEQDALAHAMRDRNLEPIASAATHQASPELEAARAALIEALSSDADTE